MRFGVLVQIHSFRSPEYNYLQLRTTKPSGTHCMFGFAVFPNN